ncbi:MAG TPA: CARDB domain-containing protein, partial [Methylomirabilota bacterium]|nr:CARDB domain-containing protein [Methylomirabilota bacterium]
ASGNYLIAQIPIGGSSTEFYTVEARRAAGYDEGIPGDAIVIHRVDTTRRDRLAQVVDPDGNGDPNDDGAMWTPGETFSDPASGITVSVGAASATSFEVTIGCATCPFPDLIETVVSNPPLAAVPGAAFRVRDTVRNQGTASAAASTTRYYLSLDRLRDPGDRLLVGSRILPALGPGEESTDSVIVGIPRDVPRGTYLLLACADDLGGVAEGNEINNCRASEKAVSVRAADLVTTAVSNPPARATRGDAFTVTDTVRNRGSSPVGASVTRYYLSLDRSRNSGDRLLAGSRPVRGLAPGTQSTGRVVLTIPSTVPVGTYFLLACADDTGKVAEVDERNNCRASAAAVRVR